MCSQAAALGYPGMSEWIMKKNHTAVQASDRMGRTPLFYAVLPADDMATYNALVRNGADKKHVDRVREQAYTKEWVVECFIQHFTLIMNRLNNTTLIVHFMAVINITSY